MAGKPKKVDVDPKVEEDLKKFWVIFTEATKYTIIVVVVVLILMAVFLL